MAFSCVLHGLIGLRSLQVCPKQSALWLSPDTVAPEAMPSGSLSARYFDNKTGTTHALKISQ